MCKKKTSKARIASAVFLVTGLAGMVLGFGPLAYEPTVVLSFIVLLAGGVLSAFGLAIVLAGESVKDMVLYGIIGSIIAISVIGWMIMANENRARRVYAALDVQDK